MKNLILVLMFSGLIILLTAQNKPLFELIEQPSYTSCEVYRLTKDSVPITVSEEVSSALECGVVLDLYEDELYYLYDLYVRRINLITNETITLFSIYPDIDGICGPFWDSSHNKIAYTIVNQNQYHNYKTPVRIIVLTLNEDRKVVEKRKFDRPVYFECGGNCYARIEFENSNTIKYQDIHDKGLDPDSVNYLFLNLKQ